MLSGIVASSLIVAAVGGAISLDRTAAFQTMVSRPLVTAPVIGYFLGNVEAALIVGAVLELLLIGDLPVGRYIPVHETGLSVLVTAAALNATPASFPVEGVLPMVLLVTIPVSAFYQKADTIVRRINIRFFDNARTLLDNGEEACLMGENLKGAALFCLTGFVTIFVTALPVMALARYLRPMVEQSAVYPAFAACLVLGVAAGVNAVYAERTLLIFTAAGIGAAAVWMAAGL